MASLGSFPAGIDMEKEPTGAVIVFVAAIAKSLTDVITTSGVHLFDNLGVAHSFDFFNSGDKTARHAAGA
jgi:hypothetical protein